MTNLRHCHQLMRVAESLTEQPLNITQVLWTAIGIERRLEEDLWPGMRPLIGCHSSSSLRFARLWGGHRPKRPRPLGGTATDIGKGKQHLAKLHLGSRVTYKKKADRSRILPTKFTSMIAYELTRPGMICDVGRHSRRA
jgi:hypothetical protein